MKHLDAAQFKTMLVSGANNLTNKHHEVDALNVFPVPDGDTGTNMNLTFSAGVKEVSAFASVHVGDLAKVLSKGLLMGARGNSGVILSQIFRGFYQSVDGKPNLSVPDLAEAFTKGTEVAYKAVMRPVEGTILTVLRESAQQAADFVKTYPDKTVLEYFEFMIASAHESLKRTPDLLPVLKEVGVVDSGAFGYIVILEGFRFALQDTPVELLANVEVIEGVQQQFENDEFGYCTEFIIRLEAEQQANFSEDAFRETLGRLGDSIVVVQDEDIVKVHVHTLTPGDALNMGQRYGEFVKLKIENMQEQHDHLTHMRDVKAPEKKKYALVAVAAGEGVQALFKSYRVDKIISGGQTMNPSTEDFVAAISTLNAEHIIILPNNSNIILAAQQAESLIEDKDVRVLPTKSIPQGLSACIMFNPEVSINDNIDEMTTAFKNVKTASVTYAIKDSLIEGVSINAGDYMGLLDKNIVVSESDKLKVTKALLDQAITEDDGLVTILVGEDVRPEELDELTTYIESKFDFCEYEVHQGQQPVYSFIFGIE
jgi:DAK2 domain fusion protein YloV